MVFHPFTTWGRCFEAIPRRSATLEPEHARMENLSKLFQFQLLVLRGVLRFVPECHTIHCVARVEDFCFSIAIVALRLH